MARSRTLFGGEIQAMTQVYGDSIGFQAIRILDDLGFNGTPWTSPGLSPGTFELHLGPRGFDTDNSIRQNRRNLFWHELAHAWQGLHSPVFFGYMLSSGSAMVWAHLTKGDRLYAYSTGEANRQWADYNAEQQASIVTAWAAQGMRVFDWRYRYITANIRAGDPYAVSEQWMPVNIVADYSSRR